MSKHTLVGLLIGCMLAFFFYVNVKRHYSDRHVSPNDKILSDSSTKNSGNPRNLELPSDIRAEAFRAASTAIDRKREKSYNDPDLWIFEAKDLQLGAYGSYNLTQADRANGYQAIWCVSINFIFRETRKEKEPNIPGYYTEEYRRQAEEQWRNTPPSTTWKNSRFKILIKKRSDGSFESLPDQGLGCLVP